MDSSRGHTRKVHTVSFHLFPTLLYVPRSKVVQGTVCKGRWRFQSFLWKINHFLILNDSAQSLACRAFLDELFYDWLSTDYPISWWSDFIHCDPSSLTLYSSWKCRTTSSEMCSFIGNTIGNTIGRTSNSCSNSYYTIPINKGIL